MISTDILTPVIAAGAALFVIAFPQPQDFADKFGGRGHIAASASLGQLLTDPEIERLNALLRKAPEGSALDRLNDSNCVSNLSEAPERSLTLCGQLVVDALDQINGNPEATWYDPALAGTSRSANEYLHLAAANICRAHWASPATPNQIDLSFSACAAIAR